MGIYEDIFVDSWYLTYTIINAIHMAQWKKSDLNIIFNLHKDQV